MNLDLSWWISILIVIVSKNVMISCGNLIPYLKLSEDSNEFSIKKLLKRNQENLKGKLEKEEEAKTNISPSLRNFSITSNKYFSIPFSYFLIFYSFF